jgi:hypothetical protein
MTASARSLKFGREHDPAAGPTCRVCVGFEHSRQRRHRRVGRRSRPLHGSGLHRRRAAWRAPSTPRGLPGGLPSSPGAGVRVRRGRAPRGDTGEVRGGAGGWARVTSGCIFPTLGTPEALPSRILRHLSSTSARRAAPRYAWLWAARAGLSHALEAPHTLWARRGRRRGYWGAPAGAAPKGR